MNWLETLTGSFLSYDVQGGITSDGSLEVYNEGPDVLYYGDVPQFTSSAPLKILASEYDGTDCTSGSAVITLGKDAPPNLVQGMTIYTGGLMGGNFTSGDRILAVNGRRITMSANAAGTDADVDAWFIQPTLATTNAIPIAAGETVRFSSALGNMVAGRTLRFFAASGNTCAVHFRKGKI